MKNQEKILDEEYAIELKRIQVDRIPLIVAADFKEYVSKIETNNIIRAKELTSGCLVSFGKLGYKIENINSLGYTNQYVVEKVQKLLPNNDYNITNPGY